MQKSQDFASKKPVGRPQKAAAKRTLSAPQVAASRKKPKDDVKYIFLPPSAQQKSAVLIMTQTREPNLKNPKKLLQNMKERLIEAMEDEEDIAESLKALGEIKSGKEKWLSLDQVKAKYGL